MAQLLEIGHSEVIEVSQSNGSFRFQTRGCHLTPWSVHPGVGVQAVLLPQLTALRRVALHHLQVGGQESSACRVLRPVVIHLTCKMEEDQRTIQSQGAESDFSPVGMKFLTRQH